jgi:hypothetical protein
MRGSLMRVARGDATDRPFVAPPRGRQLYAKVRRGLPARQLLLFLCEDMTNTVADALARIDDALGRIERVTARRVTSSAPASDDRYDRLRHRTQAALAELDTVIARVAKGGQG